MLDLAIAVVATQAVQYPSDLGVSHEPLIKVVVEQREAKKIAVMVQGAENCPIVQPPTPFITADDRHTVVAADRRLLSQAGKQGGAGLGHSILAVPVFEAAHQGRDVAGQSLAKNFAVPRSLCNRARVRL